MRVHSKKKEHLEQNQHHAVITYSDSDKIVWHYFTGFCWFNLTFQKVTTPKPGRAIMVCVAPTVLISLTLFHFGKFGPNLVTASLTVSKFFFVCAILCARVYLVFGCDAKWALCVCMCVEYIYLPGCVIACKKGPTRAGHLNRHNI